MVQLWKLPVGRFGPPPRKKDQRIDVDNIPATFSSLTQLSIMSRDATMAMLHGDSLAEAMIGEEEAMYGGEMPPGMEIDGENALEKTKFQLENPNAIMTPWGPSLAPEEMDAMLQDNDGLEALIGVPESQQAALMAEADMIMDQMGDELDDVIDIAGDMGMRENMSPFEAAKNIAGDALLGAVDFLFPPERVYAGGPDMLGPDMLGPSHPSTFLPPINGADQTDQILDGGPFAGQALSFADAMALGATEGQIADPSFGLGQEVVPFPGLEQPPELDPTIARMLDGLMANTDPDHFLERVSELLKSMEDPDNPGEIVQPALSPEEVDLWLNQSETPAVVNGQINPSHPLRSVMEDLYRVLSEPSTPTADRTVTPGVVSPTTGVTQQPTVSTPSQPSSSIRDAILSATEFAPGANFYKPFYEAMNTLEDAGRPDVREAMPQIFKDTQALFWFWKGDEAYAVQDDPEKIEKQYAEFLGKYIKDPRSFRGGKQFNDRIQWLGGLMEQDQQNPTDPEGWLRTLFVNKPGNTNILSDLYRTGGSRDYYASGIHSTLDETRKYWTGMGESNTDVFRRLTGPRTEQVEDESQIIDEADSILRPPEPIQAGWGGQTIQGG